MSSTSLFDKIKFNIDDIIIKSNSISEKEIFILNNFNNKYKILDTNSIKNAFNKHSVSQRKLTISFSHDNYLKNSGGIQKCIKTEEEVVRLKEGTYLHIYPTIPRTWLVKDQLAANLPLGININGENIGNTYANNLISALNTVSVNHVDSIIHSPLGHNLHNIIGITNSLNRKARWYFWLHDYTTLCPNFNLLRNNVIFCGAPDKQSKQCENCNAGYDRFVQFEEFKKFFDETNPIVISPSNFAKQFWLEKSKLKYNSIQVIPHYSFGEEHCKRNKNDGNLKIAFIGTPVYHKGWNDFIALISALVESPLPFSFYVFASYAPHSRLYKLVEVLTNANENSQMRCQLIENDIDIAFIGSVCPETYCLTAYEAIAADTFVVANYLSGNAAKVVEECNHGFIYRGLENLVDYLKDSSNYHNILDRRLNKHYRSLLFSKMTYSNN